MDGTDCSSNSKRRPKRTRRLGDGGGGDVEDGPNDDADGLNDSANYFRSNAVIPIHVNRRRNRFYHRHYLHLILKKENLLTNDRLVCFFFKFNFIFQSKD